MPNSKDLKDLDSQLKKTVISAESFKRSSSFDSSKSITNVHKTISNLAGHVRKVVIRVGNLEKTVENNSKKITSLKNISALQGPQIRGTNIGAKLPGGSVQSVDKNIAAITESVSSIAEILAGRKKLADDTVAFDRKKSEQEKRELAESKLEKRFDGLKRAAEKILSPVKSILDKIINFLVTVLLGRVVYKLIDWWGDPKNAGKVKSIIRFLTDWGPALLGGFILFGTRFGKGVRILTRIALSGIAKLAKAIPSLLRFARGNPRTALALAAGTYAATQLAGRAFSGGDEKPQGLVGGGYVIPRFSGGGLNFGSLFSGIGNFFSGLVSGQKGTDKIPAMLTDGEFVMSAGAVQKYGVDTLEAMNAAGGGTNKPKMMSGTVYAAGGGPIGRSFGNRSGNNDIQNIKDFIKYKIGYDVDKPSTWGTSFQSAFSAGSRPRSNQSGSGINIGSLTRGVLNQGQGLMSQAAPTIRSGMSQAQGLLNQAPQLLSQVNPLAPIGKFLSTTDLPFEKQALNYERNLNLKPGEGLTSENKKRDEDLKRRITKMYDPDKDTGIQGAFKKTYKEIVNKGLVPEAVYSPLTALLKTEQSDKLVSKLTNGKIKHLSAAITGLQYVMKGFMGPLGRPFQIDTQGLGRYQRSLMLEAQRQGHGAVGARAFGQEKYDKMQEQSMGSKMFAKLANYALGQNIFTVDKRGRATTTDTWDSSTQDLKGYVKDTKSGLKSFGDFLQGKNPQGYKGLGEAAFKGGSGLLRMMQNTPWANLHPGGVEVDLGGGFKPTDSRGNVLSSQQIRQANRTRSNVRPVKPPSKPAVIYKYSQPTNKNQMSPIYKTASPKVPSFSATTRGSSAKANTLGIPNQASYR
ncbi:MAG: hypothetical protein EBU90_08720 [Proteobacteria bacterium]|nr:hypothetical protein [Pseudomonadota bacterium]